MIIIPIPWQWKRDIHNALRIFFGINTESVFPDVDGYSTSHSMTTPLNDTTLYINPKSNYINPAVICQYLDQPKESEYTDSTDEREGNGFFDLNPIQKGMSNLLKGEYRIALDYFLKAENISQKEFSILDKLNNTAQQRSLLMIKTEIFYSIGVCYNKISNLIAAADYFEKAILVAIEIISGLKINHFSEINEEKFLKIDRYLTALVNTVNNSDTSSRSTKENGNVFFPLKKFQKIVDDYIDTLYDSKEYHKAFCFVSLLLKLKIYKKNRDILLTVHNSLLIIRKLCEKDLSATNELLSVSNEDTNFYYLIDSYHHIVWLFMKMYKKKASIITLLQNIDIKNAVDEYRQRIKSYSRTDNANFTLNWIFDDVETPIKKFFEESPGIVHYLLGLSDELKGLQCSIQSGRRV